ncbi:hypothetical protein [Shimia sp.]|uniref:hypothetical protein n=1 Tax=Shimia sp. TaxID=1954381 RepID=UPI003299EC06
MIDFIQTSQLTLVVVGFIIGSLFALLIYRQPKGSLAWEIADLVWVILGGIGTLVAIIVGIYNEDTSRLERQIGIAYTASNAFDTDAARFRLHYCAPAATPDIRQLCDKVEFLSASSAKNSALPLFLNVTKHTAPLQGLGFSLGSNAEMEDMEDKMRQINSSELLAFDPRDVDTVMALGRVSVAHPGISADYRVLALSYDTLIKQVGQLRNDWVLLQDNRYLLTIQFIAICLVAFAAPFRVGKSIVALF